MKAYIFDIDGTLANNKHREHHLTGAKKDWPAWYGDLHLDTPHEHVFTLAKHLATCAAIFYVSGRGSEYREETLKWLKDHGAPHGQLFMRAAGDRRDDDLIKIELLRQIEAKGYEIVMAFDDRNRVVKAWREAGIPCAQVAEGDF